MHLKIIANKPYNLVDIAPDGNCLFAAFLAGLKANIVNDPIVKLPSNVSELRQEIVLHMKSNEQFADAMYQHYLSIRDDLKTDTLLSNNDPFVIIATKYAEQCTQTEFVSLYYTEIVKDGVWGGDFELCALQSMYKTNIFIYKEGYEDFARAGGRLLDEYKQTVYLQFKHDHYDLLCPYEIENAVPEYAIISNKYKKPVVHFQKAGLLTTAGNLIDKVEQLYVFLNRLQTKAKALFTSVHSQLVIPEIDLEQVTRGILQHRSNTEFKLSNDSLLVDYYRFKQKLTTFNSQEIFVNVPSNAWLYQTIYINLDLIEKMIQDDSMSPKVKKHKMARSYYNLALALKSYAVINANPNLLGHEICVINYLLLQSEQLALEKSQLKKYEIPKALQDNNDSYYFAIKDEYQSTSIAADLIVLTLNYLLKPPRQAHDLSPVKINILIADLYNSVGFGRVSDIFTSYAFQDFLHLLPYVKYDMTPPSPKLHAIPASIVDATTPKTSVDIENATAALLSLEKIAPNPQEQLAEFIPHGIELTIIEAFSNILNEVYGHLHEDRLFKSNPSVIANFDSLYDCNDYNSIIKELASILNPDNPEFYVTPLQDALPNAEYQDSFTLRFKIKDNIEKFFSLLLFNRQMVMNKFTDMQMEIFAYFTTYDFVQENDHALFDEFLEKYEIRNIGAKDLHDKLTFMLGFIQHVSALNIITAEISSELQAMLQDKRHNLRSYIDFFINIINELISFARTPYIIKEDRRTKSKQTIDITMIAGSTEQIKKLLMANYTREQLCNFAINILATTVIYYDCNYTEELWRSISIGFFAPNHVMQTPDKIFSIDVSGLPVHQTKPIHGLPVADAIKAGADGKRGNDGQNGLHGNPGGNIYVICSGVDGNFAINAKGSDGTPGGNASNGSNAMAGRDGVHGKDLIRRAANVGCEEYYAKASLFRQVANKDKIFKHNSRVYDYGASSTEEKTWRDKFNTVLCMVRGTDGQKGGDGGNGGNAGDMGLGGAGGTFLIKNVAILSQTGKKQGQIKIPYPQGEDKPHGTPGQAGKSAANGRNGLDIYRYYPRQPIFFGPNKPMVEDEGRFNNVYMEDEDKSGFAVSFINQMELVLPGSEKPSFSEHFSQRFVDKEFEARANKPKHGIVQRRNAQRAVGRELSLADAYTKLLNFRNINQSLHLDDVVGEFLSDMSTDLGTSCELDSTGTRVTQLNINYNEWQKHCAQHSKTIAAKLLEEKGLLQQNIKVKHQAKAPEATAKIKIIDDYTSQRKLIVDYNLLTSPQLILLVNAIKHHRNLLVAEIDALKLIIKELEKQEVVNALHECLAASQYVEFIQRLCNRVIAIFEQETNVSVNDELNEFIVIQAKSSYSKYLEINLAKLSLFVEAHRYRATLLREDSAALTLAYKTNYRINIDKLLKVNADSHSDSVYILRQEMQRCNLLSKQYLGLDLHAALQEFCKHAEVKLPKLVSEINTSIHCLQRENCRKNLFDLYKLCLQLICYKEKNLFLVSAINYPKFFTIVDAFRNVIEYIFDQAVIMDENISSAEEPLTATLENIFLDFRSKKTSPFCIFDLIVINVLRTDIYAISDFTWMPESPFAELEMLNAAQSIIRCATDENNPARSNQLNLGHLLPLYKYAAKYSVSKIPHYLDTIYKCIVNFIMSHDLNQPLSTVMVENLKKLAATVQDHNRKMDLSILFGLLWPKHEPVIVYELLQALIKINELPHNVAAVNVCDAFYKAIATLANFLEQDIIPYILHCQAKLAKEDQNLVFKIAKKTYKYSKATLSTLAIGVLETLSQEKLTAFGKAVDYLQADFNQLQELIKQSYLPGNQVVHWLEEIDGILAEYLSLPSTDKLPPDAKKIPQFLQNMRNTLNGVLKSNQERDKAFKHIYMAHSCTNLAARVAMYTDKTTELLNTYKINHKSEQLQKAYLDMQNRILQGRCFYVEQYYDNKKALQVRVAGQEFSYADILFVAFNPRTGIFEHIKHYAQADFVERPNQECAVIQELADMKEYADNDSIHLCLLNLAHCPQNLAGYLGLPFANLSNHQQRTIVLKYPGEERPFYINDKPGLLKFIDGIPLELVSKSQDNIHHALVALQNSIKLTPFKQLNINMLLPQLGIHPLYEQQITERQQSEEKFVVDLNSELSELNVLLQQFSSFDDYNIKQILFEVSKTIIRLSEDFASEKSYSSLLSLKNLLRALNTVVTQNPDDRLSLAKILATFVNNDDSTLDTSLLPSETYADIYVQLYLARIIDCYMNIATSVSPLNIYNLQLSLKRLDLKLLQLFYNKFLKEMYNQIQSLSLAPDKAQLKIYERKLEYIIKNLSSIVVTDDALLQLLNAPFNNWESELNNINFDQLVEEWHELNVYENGKLKYFLNRIRLNIGDQQYSRFLHFMHALKNKVNSNINLAHNLIIELAFKNIKIDEALDIIEHNDPEGWDELLAPKSHSELRTVSDIFADIRPQFREENYPHINNLESQAAIIMYRLHSHVKYNAGPDIAAINTYFAQLFVYHTASEKTSWLFKNNPDTGELNIIQFVEYLAFAAYATDSEKKLPRATQVISLLLSLQANDRGLLQQIKTGEGKTLIIGMLAAAKALLGFKVDVVSSNADLAIKGQDDCDVLFKALNLRSTHNIGDEFNFENYNAHIVYGDSSSFEGHVCRNRFENIFHKRYEDPEHPACLINDEVDSASLDKAAEMLRITHNHAAFKHLDLLLIHINAVVLRLLNESGLSVVNFAKHKHDFIPIIQQKLLINGEFLAELMIPKYLLAYCKKKLSVFIEKAIDARLMLAKDNYIITEKEIVVMDKSTGVESYSTQYSEGLHQALQIAHQLEITPLGLESNYISNKSFFKSYGKNIFGLTGTLGLDDSRDFLRATYDVDLIDLPTHKDVLFRRIESLVCTDDEWANTVAEEALRINVDQPVLIICDNIDSVENLHRAIQALITSQNLDTKIKLYKSETDEVEKHYKELGGATKGDIIIATNKGGRGTDININIDESPQGLHVILSYMPENARIEMQAFGRAARKGEPGTGNYVIAVDNVLDEAADLQIEKLILKREAQDKMRIRVYEKETIPQNDIKEDLAAKFRELVKQISAKSAVAALPVELRSIYIRLLMNVYAFWLEDESTKIKDIDVYKTDLRDEIIQDFTKQVANPLLKHADKISGSFMSLDIFKMPEDLISLAIAYTKEQQYSLAIYAYTKAIELGDVTGVAESSVAQIMTKVNSRVTTENKKALRRHVKQANFATDDLISTLKRSVAYLDIIEKILIEQEDSGFKPNGSSVQAEIISERIEILDIHVQELNKIIGAKCDTDLLNKTFAQQIIGEAREQIVNKLYDNHFITKNFIRKRWVLAKNRITLKEMLKAQLADKADCELLAKLFTTENLGKDLAKLSEFNRCLYSQDEIWGIMQPLANGVKTAIKQCYRLNAQANPPNDLGSTFIENLEQLVADLEKDKNIQATGHIFLDSANLPTILHDRAFFELLLKYKIIIPTEALLLSTEALELFNSLQWGKYSTTKMFDNELGVTTVAACLLKNVTSIMENDPTQRYLFKSDLPYAPLEIQKGFVIEMLNAKFILKSDSLNVCKYELDTDKIKAKLRETITTDDNQLTLLVNLIVQMQGNIRKADNELQANFVKYKDIYPDANDEPDLEYFEDLLLDRFLSISNRVSSWDWNVAGLVAIAVAQAIAGICLIIFVPGAGVLLGEALIDLALQDLFYAYSYGRSMKWSDWAQQKVLTTLLTVGFSFIGGIGVPVNSSGLRSLFNCVKRIVQRHVTSYVIDTVSNAAIQTFSDQVVDSIVESLCQDMLNDVQQRSQRTIAQIYHVFNSSPAIYREIVNGIKQKINSRIQLMHARQANDVGLAQSIASAAESTGKIMAEWASLSDNAAVKGIGAAIKSGMAVTKLVGFFTQAAQFDGMQNEINEYINLVLRAHLQTSIAYNQEEEARAHQNDVNVATAADSAQIQAEAEQAFKKHLHEMIATAVRSAISANVHSAYRQEQQHKRSTSAQRLRSEKANIKISFNKSLTPIQLDHDDAEVTQPKLVKADLDRIFVSIPEVPMAVRYSETALPIKLGVLTYCNNLAKDPNCYFELPMIANYSNVEFCIFNTRHSISHFIYPDTKSHKRPEFTISFIESSTSDNTKNYNLADTSSRTSYGSPTNLRMVSHPSYLKRDKILLFSVLSVIKGTIPSEAEIDEYRARLIEYSLNAKSRSYLARRV